MLTPLKPPHAYGRTPPNLHNLRSADGALLRQVYRLAAQERAACPAEGFTVYDHCYVCDGCYVMEPSLEWVPESVIDYGIAETIKPMIQEVIRGRHHRPLGPSPHPTVVIAKAGSDNYGHTLTDILPKLVNIARAGLPAIRLLLPTGMQHFAGFVTAILARDGVQAELEFHAPATVVEARGVHFFSPVAQHNTRKSTTFLELADRARSLYGVQMARTRRLYVRRGGRDHRTLHQAEAVEAVFARYGFESVYPPDLPLEGQIRLFASASHIAGAMGAGMANIGWAPPGCEVLVIDPGIGDSYFWDFACLMQQPFDWLFAAPLQGYTPELSLRPFGVDPALLGATLRLVYDTPGPASAGRGRYRSVQAQRSAGGDGEAGMPSLDAIGLGHGTDKASNIHDYLHFYERRFSHLRNESFVLIEIGVLKGGSTRTWAEFFPRAQIVGIDLEPACKQHEGPNIAIRIGDASDAGFLFGVVEEFGRPTIVVDDGSHRWDHQILSLQTFFPVIKPGGFFVMEDLDTSFDAHLRQAPFQGVSTISAFDYLAKLAARTVAEAAFGGAHPHDIFIEANHARVGSIEFARRTCVISKKPEGRSGPT